MLSPYQRSLGKPQLTIENSLSETLLTTKIQVHDAPEKFRRVHGTKETIETLAVGLRGPTGPTGPPGNSGPRGRIGVTGPRAPFKAMRVVSLYQQAVEPGASVEFGIVSFNAGDLVFQPPSRISITYPGVYSIRWAVGPIQGGLPARCAVVLNQKMPLDFQLCYLAHGTLGGELLLTVSKPGSTLELRNAGSQVLSLSSTPVHTNASMIVQRDD